MSRRRGQRRARPYQPMPRRRTGAWLARLLIFGVGVALLLGSLAFAIGR